MRLGIAISTKAEKWIGSIDLRNSSDALGLLMTRQPTSTVRQAPLHYLTRSVRRTSGFVLADHPSRTGRRDVRMTNESAWPVNESTAFE